MCALPGRRANDEASPLPNIHMCQHSTCLGLWHTAAEVHPSLCKAAAYLAPHQDPQQPAHLRLWYTVASISPIIVQAFAQPVLILHKDP